jgi:hypothetical protein
VADALRPFDVLWSRRERERLAFRRWVREGGYKRLISFSGDASRAMDALGDVLQRMNLLVARYAEAYGLEPPTKGEHERRVWGGSSTSASVHQTSTASVHQTSTG